MFDHEERQFELVAVVAMARNRVIGLAGEMPWRLKADLQRYKRLTMGRPMIMGRKTLLSIGRLLPGRDTIVLTRSGTSPIEGALAAVTPADALRLAAERAVARGTREIAIVGGAEIYRLFLDRLDRVELTRVEAEPDGDTFFPPLDERGWRREFAGEMPASPGDTAAATFFKISRSRS